MIDVLLYEYFSENKQQDVSMKLRICVMLRFELAMRNLYIVCLVSVVRNQKKSGKDLKSSIGRGYRQEYFAIETAYTDIFIDEPVTLEKAMTSEEAIGWKTAMEEEMESVENNQTRILMPQPPNRKAIKCKWVYKLERYTDGSIDRFKARL
ncbi:hypothetical protein JTB14_037504 [Gonioctena quinquepunctata]|nr:hypothetical protein JTB14_037504 [Gonioctena quinquepunctata]